MSMDYSLVQRNPDGSGMFLVTTPGSPDVGSYETEAQLREWIKSAIIYSGYYYNGNFYKEAAHTTVVNKVDGAIYVDLSDGSNLSLYYCDNTTYKALTEEAQVQAIRTELQNGTLVPLKAKQDQNGDVIDTTYAKKADLLDGTIVVKEAEIATKDEDGNNIKATYATKAEASDLKDALSATNKRVSNLEQKSGSIVSVDYPEYSVDGEVPAGKAKYAEVSKLRGVTVAWNSLFELTLANLQYLNTYGTWAGNVYTLETGLTFTVDVANGTVTANGTVANNSSFTIGKWDYISSHKALLTGCPSGGSASGYRLRARFADTTVQQDVGAGVFVNSATSQVVTVDIRFNAGVSFSNTVFRPDFHDLTQMFGSSVANYIYTLEQGTAGAGVALFNQLVKALDFSAETGELVSTVYSAVKSVGVNILGNSFEVGSINVNTGEDYPSNNVMRTVGYVPVEPSTTYYLLVESVSGSSTFISACFYDINKNFLTSNYSGGYLNNSFTVPAGAYYMRFALPPAYGTTWKNDVQICLNSLSDKTTFHSYMTDSLTLPTPVTLRGLLKVVNNNLVVDGDEYGLESGEIDRKYNTLKLDDYTWTLNSENTDYLRVNVSATIPKAFENGGNINNFDGGGWKMYTTGSGTTENVLDIRDSLIIINIAKSYLPTADVSGFNAWCVGKEITYERATPDADTPVTPINDPYIKVGGGGSVNTTQTNDPVIVSGLTMTYLTL